MPYDLPDDSQLPRRPIAPRMPELGRARLEPLAPQKPPQVFVGGRDEEVVPDEDNPLRGWRSLGLVLINPALWPRHARRNPIMVYFSGRRRGRGLEDFLGILPWLILTATVSCLAFAPAKWAGVLYAAVVASLVVVPLGACVTTLIMVSLHLRRNIATMRLEELLLTYLKPADIVQGLAIRPIAVQNVGVFLYCGVQLLALPIGEYIRNGDVGIIQVLLFTMGTALIQYMSQVFIEFAAAFAIRANLFLRQPIVAGFRAAIDSLRVLGLATLTIGAFAFCSFQTLFSSLITLIAIAPLFIAVRAMVGWVLDSAIEAVAWTIRHHDEWWVYQEEYGGGDAPTRGLFSPWRELLVRRNMRPAVNAAIGARHSSHHSKMPPT